MGDKLTYNWGCPWTFLRYIPHVFWMAKVLPQFNSSWFPRLEVAPGSVITHCHMTKQFGDSHILNHRKS
jgi:hypothetical protein